MKRTGPPSLLYLANVHGPQCHQISEMSWNQWVAPNFPAILDVVKQFAIAGEQINPMPVSSGNQPFQSYANSPSISADGTADAIVWIVEAPGYEPNLPINPNTGMPNPPAVLGH